MAVDKLIDSAKESACRTAEANAIRAKTGGTAAISYDFANGKGFSDAIAGIPSGGISLEDVFAYVLDFDSDPITMTAGAVNKYGQFFTT